VSLCQFHQIIGQTVADISIIKTVAVRHLGFVITVCVPGTTLKSVLDCLYLCAKFGCSPCSNFDNIMFEYFARLA